MSKLDDNNRWSGKMLLTEHVEQYESRHEARIKGRATLDELTLIRDKVVYPHIQTMLERGIESMRLSNFPLRDLNIRCLEVLFQRVSDDAHALNVDLRRRNIKVVPDESGDGVIYHKYICRGYEDRFGITHEAIRMEISNRLTQYTDDLRKSFTQRLTKQ